MIAAFQALAALSLMQPFASAIAIGPKRVENRPFRRHLPPEGRWYGLHAGKSLWPLDDERASERMLDEWRQARGKWADAPALEDLPRGALLGVMHVREIVAIDGPRAALLGVRDDPWTMGPWLWLVDDVKLLPAPIPMRGMQGTFPIWRMDEGAARAAFGLTQCP